MKFKMAKEYSDFDDEFGDDDNIYDEDIREMLLDNDELSPREEAFLRGWDDFKES